MFTNETIQRFESHIEKTDSCWIWKGFKTTGGYCNVKFQGKTFKAHRFSYELYKGEIPKGLTIDHLCRNRACVNPDHLEAVSLKENVLRGNTLASINSSKTCCIRGHKFNENNTYLYKGRRICRKCDDLRHQKLTLMESQKFLRHGDVDIRRIDTTSLKSIPSEARPDGKILMHGEATGHHHKAKSGQVLVLEKPIQVEVAGEQVQVEKFLRVEQDTKLEHQEHPTIPIPAGDYLILQERTYNPFDEEIRRVMD